MFWCLTRKENKFSKSKHKFGNISGVAVNKEDNIYVCDSKHCVYKFNKRGDPLN